MQINYLFAIVSFIKSTDCVNLTKTTANRFMNEFVKFQFAWLSSLYIRFFQGIGLLCMPDKQSNHDEFAMPSTCETNVPDHYETKTARRRIWPSAIKTTRWRRDSPDRRLERSVSTGIAKGPPIIRQITRIGLDIAKRRFQVHAVVEAGKEIFNRKLPRDKVLGFLGSLPPCGVALEACSSSHHWGREIGRLGHRVRLISPNYVKPFVKRGKSDATTRAPFARRRRDRTCGSYA